jgi:hypothetical protein
MITVSSAQEWLEACMVLSSSPIKRIYVSFEESNQPSQQKHHQNKQSIETNIETIDRAFLFQQACWQKESGAGGGSCYQNKKNRKLMKKQTTLPEFSRSEKGPKQPAVNEIPIDSIAALKVGSFVHLSSRSSGKNLRVLQDGKVDFLGGQGQWASFLVHRGVHNPNAVRFQSAANQNYWLRISKKGELNALGKGGPLTEFVLIAPQLKKNNKKNLPEQAAALSENTPYMCSPMFVCLRAAAVQLNVGALKNGSIKEQPSKVATGKCAHFVILPKLNFVNNEQ